MRKGGVPRFHFAFVTLLPITRQNVRVYTAISLPHVSSGVHFTAFRLKKLSAHALLVSEAFPPVTIPFTAVHL